MRVAILADLHLGFGAGDKSNPRSEDSFKYAEDAIRIAAEKADLILVAGDIFDRSRPGMSTLLRALHIFEMPWSYPSPVKIVGGTKKTLFSPRGTPVVAIRGNHDVGADLHNHPVSLLERAHRLIYLNGENIVFEKEGERVAITGAGWVPDRNLDLVTRYFRERVPPPVPKAFNILLLHQPLQGIGKYPGETPLPVSVLPPGFDVYVTGHLHWHVEKRVGDYWIVIPGSTIRTQLTDREVEDDRAFWILDTETRELEEVFIPSARRGFLVRVNVSSKDRETVFSLAKEKIEDAIKKNDRDASPIVKLVLEGETDDVLDLSALERYFADRAIVKVFDRTESRVVDAVRQAAEEHESATEVFSDEYVLSVMRSVMEGSGLEAGPDFDAFYRKIVSLEKIPSGNARDVLLESLEQFLMEKDVIHLAKNANTESSDSPPVSSTAEKRKTGSITDWLG